ncbi:hypothetical protein [Agromyces sp. Marseille-Q5079]|uniref:hypothetical protein n=1 Tax=Agromyces sp. Marseille-Q5079 TaxID=3439059 RepID=UPI003D9C8E2F
MLDAMIPTSPGAAIAALGNGPSDDGVVVRGEQHDGPDDPDRGDRVDDPDGVHDLGQSIVLLAETDIMLDGEAAPMLEEVARRLLAVPVEVISATALALFAPERLERLVAASAPL